MSGRLPYSFIFLIGLFCQLFPVSASAQEMTYHEEFAPYDSLTTVFFLGKTKDRIWLFKTSPRNFPTIHLLDSTGKEQLRVSVNAIGLKRIFRPAAIFANDTVSVFYQYRSGDYVYQNVLLLDQNGKTLGNVQQLDSARTDILKDGALMQCIPIPEKKKILLYRMIMGLYPGKMIVDHSEYDYTGSLLEKTNHTINFDRTVQELSAAHLHANGNVYFTIYDKPDPYRLYSTITLYQINCITPSNKIREIPFKGFKPIRPIFVKTNNPAANLGLCSIYLEKESIIANGVLVAEVDLINKSAPVSTTYFPLQKHQNKYTKSGPFQLPVSFRPSRNDKLVLYAAFQKAAGEWNFLLENGYNINHSNATNNFPGQSNPNSADVNNFTPSQEMDQLRNQAIRNINYASNNASGSFQFGNQGANNITPLGGVSNYFTTNNGYLDQLEKYNTQPPNTSEDRFYANEYKESQKLIHYFISADARDGVTNRLKFQSTIITKQLPLQSVKITNEQRVMIADIGNNSDRFDFKSMETSGANRRKEVRIKKGKTILWRESVLPFQNQLYFLYVNEQTGRVGLASIKE